MATSTYGTPYVESGDLVSNWPITSQSVADRVDDVSIKGNGVNAQTGTTYTTVLTDAGKTVTLNNAAAVAVTIPPNASVAYETGTQIKFLNLGAGTVTLGPGSGVTLNGDTLTADQYVGLAAIKVDTDEWVVLPFSGGVGSAQISDTPTGSYTGYEYWTYTASGTLNVTKAGFVDALIVGAGAGAGAYGGAGAGGYLEITNAYLPAGSATVTVAAGGAVGNNGLSSRLGTYFAAGGGVGGTDLACNPNGAGNGGSGGGGRSSQSVLGGAGTPGLGNNGGSGSGSGGDGGGGAGAAGVGAASGNGGDGGAGLSSSITGSAVTRAGGGGGRGTVGGAGGAGGGGAGSSTTATAGTANTGGGGGAGSTSAAGGSGVVIVRVKV